MLASGWSICGSLLFSDRLLVFPDPLCQKIGIGHSNSWLTCWRVQVSPPSYGPLHSAAGDQRKASRAGNEKERRVLFCVPEETVSQAVWQSIHSCAARSRDQTKGNGPKLHYPKIYIGHKWNFLTLNVVYL